MSLHVDIRKFYKNFTLDVRLDSEKGTLGILGASGSGKSLTLKCIAGIETPDEGRIVLNGRTLFDSSQKINLRPQQRRVGYLFQNYALFPHLSVAGNIACALPGRSADKTSATQVLLAQFQLTNFEAHTPAQLSGGQQQRVALARILASRPEALLLDEPFSALDAHLKELLQMQMTSLLEQYAGDALMVSHNRDEVYSLCENLLVLQEGRSLVCGNTRELFKNPRHVAAARLTGCKNISRARPLAQNRVLAQDWGVEFTIASPLPENISHIGIRAHSFVPAAAGALNSIRTTITKTTPSPFEWNVLFTNADAPEIIREIWWKYPKNDQPAARPAYLSAKSDNILLLVE